MSGECEELVVRIDNGDGSKTLCSWSRAEEVIRVHFHPHEHTMRMLAMGHPVRTTWATYQHRDFVEGLERCTT